MLIIASRFKKNVSEFERGCEGKGSKVNISLIRMEKVCESIQLPGWDHIVVVVKDTPPEIGSGRGGDTADRPLGDCLSVPVTETSLVLITESN